MGSYFLRFVTALKAAFEDRLLQILLLAVICGAFGFALFLGADLATVTGILIFGGISAFLESKHHRDGK